MYAGEIVEAGPIVDALPRSAAPVHADAVRGHARPVRRRRGALDPRRAAAARPEFRAARSRRAATRPSSRARRAHPRRSRSAPATCALPPQRRPCGCGGAVSVSAGRRRQRRCSRSTDLVTRYPIRAGSSARSRGGRSRTVHAVEGVSFSVARGRDAGARRRVGLRQDDDRPDGDAHGRADGRRDPLPRPGARRPRAARAAPDAARHADHLPGSVRVARPALPRPRHGRGAAADPRRRAAGGRARRRVRDALERAGLHAARAVPRPLPARAVGRPAPARRDRRGAGARAEAADRRRAGVDARRVGARGHPGAARRAAHAAAWGS